MPAAAATLASREPSRSSADRKAASVLPEPVGAQSSTWAPVAMAGQACSWHPVLEPKVFRNQDWVGVVNSETAPSVVISSGYPPRPTANLARPSGGWQAAGEQAGSTPATRAQRSTTILATSASTVAQQATIQIAATIGTNRWLAIASPLLQRRAFT